MGELCDEWSSQGRRTSGAMSRMSSRCSRKAGAAGAVHGALQAGALTTTFTASQGLLLMIPNMYKIAGELTPFTMHVAARTLATHALSIFGDHSDVMACRQTGFAMLCSSSVQEAHDFAAIAHAATLESRVPFLHFFDGFRTSHEVAKIEELADDDLRAHDFRRARRARTVARALTPDRPVLRGTAQNPDVFFQAREAANRSTTPARTSCEQLMDRFAALTGRRYQPLRLRRASGGRAGHRDHGLRRRDGARDRRVPGGARREGRRAEGAAVPAVLDRRASSRRCPARCARIAVLDRTKEPGARRRAALPGRRHGAAEARRTARRVRSAPIVIGGRYGLSSKEFTPAMVKAVFDELAKRTPQNHFTVGIVDDVTHTSLPCDPTLRDRAGRRRDARSSTAWAPTARSAPTRTRSRSSARRPTATCRATSSTTRRSRAPSPSRTCASGPRPIRSPYLVTNAPASSPATSSSSSTRSTCSSTPRPGRCFLLNAPYAADDASGTSCRAKCRSRSSRRRSASTPSTPYAVAQTDRHGRPHQHDHADLLLRHLRRAAARRGDRADQEGDREDLRQAGRGSRAAELRGGRRDAGASARGAGAGGGDAHAQAAPPMVSAAAPDFVQRVTAVMLAGKGDLLPVSAFPVDGTWPIGTAKWEKRNIAHRDPGLGPRASASSATSARWSARTRRFAPRSTSRRRSPARPPTFKSTALQRARVQGQGLHHSGRAGGLHRLQPVRERLPGQGPHQPEAQGASTCTRRRRCATPSARTTRSSSICPRRDRAIWRTVDHKSSQFLEPLFEYSGACAGCGETPYIKLLTQLFGDRLLIANATGCSSIYGGNLPTTPYTTNRDGRGPAWSNSLFEDNAEFGLGLRLGVDATRSAPARWSSGLPDRIGDNLVARAAERRPDRRGRHRRRSARVCRTCTRSSRRSTTPEARRLETLADYLVKKSVWLVGGDGWAYDIGYGGLDHVLAGQPQRQHPRARHRGLFEHRRATVESDAARRRREVRRRRQGSRARRTSACSPACTATSTWRGSPWAPRCAQTVQALLEAEAYPGPSLIIAYSHCIAHGYDMALRRGAAEAGRRFRRVAALPVRPAAAREGRAAAASRLRTAQGARGRLHAQRVAIPHGRAHRPGALQAVPERVAEAAEQRYAVYQQLAGITVPQTEATTDEDVAPMPRRRSEECAWT